MKLRFYGIIFLFYFTLNLFSQNIEFETGNFIEKKDDFISVIKSLEKGEELYEKGRLEIEEYKKKYLASNKFYPVSQRDYRKIGAKNFIEAIPFLNLAQVFNPNNAKLNYKLGFIFFMSNPLSPETLKYLETAYALNPLLENDLCYWLAWTYHLNYRWDEAIKYYEIYLSQKLKSSKAVIEDVKKKISECGFGKIFSAQPERVLVTNLGPTINTPFPEYRPAISSDEETIFFTSRRSNSIGGKKDLNDNGFFEDIYTSSFIEKKWTPAKSLSKKVNSENHDATAGLSADGSKLYIYRATTFDGGDLYESNANGTDWEEPVSMNKYINTKYQESSASISFDNKRFFFVSDKESGLGDGDIYFSDLNANEEWGPAKNIGVKINTKYREDAVFMHPDGVTLYFSSKGHNSMGGYDIFKSTLINGEWQTPINLGYPINGPDDDAFFVISGSGNDAFFSSAKQGGYGESDIYKITFLGPENNLQSNDLLTESEKKADIISSKLTLLKGTITDQKTKKPIEAIFELIDIEKNIKIATFKSNSITGKYLVSLPSGKNYAVSVKQKDYLFHSENFLIQESEKYQEVDLNIELKKIDVGNSIILKNIFFDFNKATLQNESINEIERLIKLLKDNPQIKIELSSHTDNAGLEDYNLTLSNNRSETVTAYIIAKGIAKSRIISKGYGETNPIESNENKEGMKKNRRTEFKILEK